MNKQKYITVLMVFVITVFFSWGVQAEEFMIVGSSTIQPLIEEARQFLAEEIKGKIVIKGGGSSVGIRQAIEGEAEIGTASRALTEEEKEELEYTTIGLDALAIIVNERVL